LYTDISKKSEFEVEVKNPNGTNIFTVRLPDFEDIKAELGKMVLVTIFKTIKLDVADVADWLELYGFIQGDFRSVLQFNNHSVIFLSRLSLLTVSHNSASLPKFLGLVSHIRANCLLANS